MRNIPALTSREVGSFFHSPMAYIVGVLFLLMSGLFFYIGIASYSQATLRPWAQTIVFILIFVAPILSMRQFAEEKRVGTIESLMTTPVTDVEVVVAKFLGVLIFFLAMLAPTLIYVPIMGRLALPGSVMDYGSFFTCYLGVALTGCMFLACGLLASSLTNNQIVASVIGVVSLLAITLLLGLVPDPGSFTASTPWQRALQSIFAACHFMYAFKHLDSFIKGIIDTRDIVYFLALTAYFLFLTVRVVENRKWK